MRITDLFTRRIRGVRLINAWAGCVLVSLVVGVYLVKTFAGGEGAQTASVERNISEEGRRIRLLQAEVAYLEQPERLNRLSAQYLGLEPTPSTRRAELSALPDLSHAKAPKS